MKPQDVVAAVVIHNKRMNANQTLLAFLRSPRPGFLLEMCCEPEHRAFCHLALHADLAVHHSDQLAGDGQSQSSAAVLPGRRAILLAECLKQVLLLLRLYSDAS